MRIIMAVEATVPCDGCTVCCESDAVFLNPGLGDDLTQYKMEWHPQYRRLMLAHKLNGECWYLDKDVGCTIYEARPSRCRTMDCRRFLDLSKKKKEEAVKAGILSDRILKAAKAAKERSSDD